MIDIWIVVAIVMAVIICCLVLWGMYRENHFSKVTNKLARGINSLPRAMEQIDNAFIRLGAQLSDLCDSEKGHREEYLEQIKSNRQLVLDVERRLAELVRDLRNERQANIYNTNATGGQTNQGGNVRGDQS